MKPRTRRKQLRRARRDVRKYMRRLLDAHDWAMKRVRARAAWLKRLATLTPQWMYPSLEWRTSLDATWRQA